MNSQFHFRNFEPNFKLRLQSNLVLSRTLDIAPYGAFGVGLLEKRGEYEYCCALDIYSAQGPFMASVVGESPEQALESLEEKIRKQISWWKSHRSCPVIQSYGLGHPAVVAS